jgi:hypothetical protein
MNSGKNLVALLRRLVRTPAPLVAFVATILLGGLLSLGDVTFKKAGAMSIVSLELAWRTECAQKILNSWINVHPVPPILLDFLFIAAYSYLLFAFGTIAARDADYRNRSRLAEIAGCAALAGLVAGACDVVENFGMLLTIGIGAHQPVPFLTSLFATVKFLLVVVSFMVSLATLLWPDRLRFSD